MAQKISVTIDLSKLDKNKIVTRTYQNKNGETITCKDYKFDVIEVKEPKVLKETDTYRMIKTHFISDTITKQEKNDGQKAVTLGDGITFKYLDDSSPIISEKEKTILQGAMDRHNEQVNVSENLEDDYSQIPF